MGFTRGTRYTLLYAGHGGDVVQVAKIMLETFRINQHRVDFTEGNAEIL